MPKNKKIKGIITKQQGEPVLRDVTKFAKGGNPVEQLQNEPQSVQEKGVPLPDNGGRHGQLKVKEQKVHIYAKIAQNTTYSNQ